MHESLRHLKKKRTRGEAIKLRRDVIGKWLPYWRGIRDDTGKKSLDRYKAVCMIDYCTEIVEDLDFFFSERV